MITQENEHVQISIEGKIILHLNELYNLLQTSDDPEAESHLGYIAQMKVYWEEGIPMDEQTV